MMVYVSPSPSSLHLFSFYSSGSQRLPRLLFIQNIKQETESEPRTSHQYFHLWTNYFQFQPGMCIVNTRQN